MKKFITHFAVVFLTILESASFVHAAATPRETEVLIIGAGLSGLAAAYELKKAGVPFHVLELTPRVGGRVRTVRYERPGEKPLVADSGMEEYWESNPAVEYLKELKLPTRADFAASSLMLEGKLEILREAENGEAYLNRILSVQEREALEAFKKRVATLSIRLKEVRAKGEGLDPEFQQLTQTSFADWVQTFGPEPSAKMPKRVAEWIRISIECEAGTSWDRFSALDGIDEFHIFLGQGEKSYRVIGGNQVFTDALAARAGAKNISLNRMVKKIDTSKKTIEVGYLDTETNRAGVIRAKKVVSTIPLFRLFEVQFEPALSESKRTAIASQTWGSYFKAHILLKSNAARFWEKGEHSILPILSDSELGVIYDGAPDHEGGTRLLSLLITGDRAEAFNFAQVDLVRSTLRSSLDRLWPGIASEIIDMEFYRYHPRAIAGWPVGRSRFDVQSDEVRKPERGVHFAGDFTENTHSSGAFISARRVVTEILAGRKGARK